MVSGLWVMAMKRVGARLHELTGPPEPPGYWAPDDDGGQRSVCVGLRDIPLGSLHRLGRVGPRNRPRGRGNAFEVFFRPCQRLFGIEIAHDNQRGVIRLVIRVEKSAHVLEGGFVEVRDAAYGSVMISVHGERGGAKIFFD